MLPGTVGLFTGATTTSGSKILYLDSRIARGGTADDIAEGAITVVHEAQHLADEALALSDRLSELRAHRREADFANAIGRADLSQFATDVANHGLARAAQNMYSLYGF